MRHLISSAVFGLLPIPPEADPRNGCAHLPFEAEHSQCTPLSPEDTEKMAFAVLARLRRALGINVGASNEQLDPQGALVTASAAFHARLGSQMSKRRGARYKILGRGWGPQRIHLLLNCEDEVDAKARELAAMPGQSPVAVIDTDSDRSVTFYFADGQVCTVVRSCRANAQRSPQRRPDR